VLDRNLFDIPATEISETRVLLTLFEGKPVHGRPDEL
jgi:predicted amidohydrolase YtcJ